MRLNKFVRVLPAAVLLLCSAVSAAEDFTYTTNNGAIIITGYTGSGGSVAIPDTINGLPVTEIGNYAFRDCSHITAVTIPPSVSYIGYNAFRECSGLTGTVVIPDGVTEINHDTFYNCSGLANVSIPDSVTRIGDDAFLGCSGLTEVTIPEGVTLIGDSAFLGCSRLRGTVTLPSSLSHLGPSAFAGCRGLTGVNLSEGLRSIESFAFRDCSGLTEILIPSSVAHVESSAFVDCGGLASITVAAENSYYTSEDGVLFDKSRTRLIRCPGGKTGHYTIPADVTSIAKYAFYECRALTEITIPEGVSFIREQAFTGCSSLTELTIPSTVNYIIDGTFRDCSGLTSITVSAENPNLMSTNGVLFEDSYFGTNLIQYPVARTGSYTIPDGVTAIGSYAFAGCQGLTDVDIPNGVTTISDHAFAGCSGLTGLTIPEGVTQIEPYAFDGCSGLTGTLMIPSSVRVLYAPAFLNCSGLTAFDVADENTSYVSEDGVLFRERFGGLELIQCPAGKTGAYTIPTNVISIADGAFAGCSGLTGTLTIPEGIVSIQFGMFSGCHGLTGLTIPASVTRIDGRDVFAFQNCSNLTAITVAADNQAYMSEDGVVFDKDQTTLIQCPGGKSGSYTIPAGVTTIGEAAFLGCRKLTDITLPAATTAIEFWAFRDCAGLTAFAVDPGNPSYMSTNGVLFSKGQTRLLQFPSGKPGAYTIPDSVTAVEEYAFMFSSLTNVTVPASVQTIGHAAFRPCYELQAITVEAENPFYMSENGVLFDKDRTRLIQCPGGKTGHYKVPAGVVSIDSFSFEGCRQLTGITIPVATTQVGGDLFYDCGSLPDVYFRGAAVGRSSSHYENDELTVYHSPDAAGWGAIYDGHPTVLWNPQILTAGEAFGMKTNGFGFHFTESDGGLVVTETCTDLAEGVWRPVQTNSMDGGTVYFLDSAANGRSGFYRLSMP